MTEKPKTYDKVLREEAARVKDWARRKASGEKILTHVPTGFEPIDGTYGGIRVGITTELMAHTGDGKSSFLRQCAEGAARAGCGVLWFVAEDPRDATAERQLATDTGISTVRIGRLDLQPSELESIERAASEAAPWARRILPVFEAQDTESVLEVIDETKEVGGAPLKLVVIDYVQVLGMSKTIEDDIATLGKELHQRARERGFAILVASQVGTPVITRGREAWFTKADITQIRPSLGDTEWCKRFEKLSKAVWSLVRPNRWKREFGEDVVDDYAELHVIKANFGPMGWVPLNWEGSACKFTAQTQ